MTKLMAERKPEWPEAGDLVIGMVKTVTDYGAYAKLDEYGQRGLLQWHATQNQAGKALLEGKNNWCGNSANA